MNVRASAGAAEDPWDGRAFAGNPKAIAAAAGDRVERGEKETVVLLDERRIVLDSASRMVDTHRLVYRIGAGDFEPWSNIEAGWQPWRQQRPSVRARVIAPDGKETTFDSKTFSEGPVGEDDINTFDDSRVLRAPLPALTAGAVVEAEVVVKDTAPISDRGISRYIAVGHDIEALQTLVTIEVPSALPIKYGLRLLDGVAPVRTVAGGKTTLAFEIGHLDAIDYDDLSFETSDEPRQPYVAFSTSPSWSVVADGYSRIVDAQIAQSNVTEWVREVTASKLTKEEIVDEFLQRVQRKIHYKAVELGEAAIVPTTPSETLRLEYGDCKDQAALLIALLRGAGIEAHMALLSASNFDADSELPGLGSFDHAIVYVPGDTPLWLDSTSGFARLGQLPQHDYGRLALIAKPGTDELVRIPESMSRTSETREVFLSEEGEGRVVETTEFSGTVEMDIRSNYSRTKDVDLQDEIQDYVEGVYEAVSAEGVEYSDPSDLTTPFQLRLEAKQAGVVQTGVSGATVAIHLTQLVEDLAILADRDSGGSLVIPGSTREWRYRIVPPIGFRPSAIPESKSLHIGPATVSWEFSESGDHAVTGVFKFDTGPSRYTSDDVADAQEALLGLDEEPTLTVSFDQVGESLLADGNVRQALEEFRRLAAAHPGEALHHTQIARALLSGGLGEAAREEARRAIALEPQSVIAHQTLGLAMEHDIVGARFKRGWDRAAAMAAYRKALDLGPDNVTTLLNLGVLLEHNVQGYRYGPGADLNGAIDLYKRAIANSRAEDEKRLIEDNLSVALLRANRFTAAKETAARPDIKLAATAVQDGAVAAVREAGRLFTEAKARQAALLQTGSVLLDIRQYQQAAEVLRAAARGSTNAAEILSRADQAAQMMRLEDLSSPDDTDRKASPVDYQSPAWLGLFDGQVTDEDISTALRAVSLTQSQDRAALHTLAALYAEAGKPAEAREVLLQSMDVGGSSEVTSDEWYVFGRIYEQLGEREAAAAAFKRVVPDPDPVSSYALAQRRLKALDGN